MSDAKVYLELVESAASYAGRLHNALEKTVEDLRADKTREGLMSFSNSTEGIGWFIDAITALNNSPESRMQFDTEEIKNNLKEILDSAENMDYVLLADLIEYEMLATIEKWGLALDDILESEE